MIHLDTSFLVDLLREQTVAKSGPATRFLEGLEPEEDLGTSVHVICELCAGAELSTRRAQELEKINQLCTALSVAYPDEQFPKIYGTMLAQLEGLKRKVSTMDLLIAAAAVQAGVPLATRNRKEFSRIPGLQLLGY